MSSRWEAPRTREAIADSAKNGLEKGPEADGGRFEGALRCELAVGSLHARHATVAVVGNDVPHGRLHFIADADRQRTPSSFASQRCCSALFMLMSSGEEGDELVGSIGMGMPFYLGEFLCSCGVEYRPARLALGLDDSGGEVEPLVEQPDELLVDLVYLGCGFP